MTSRAIPYHSKYSVPGGIVYSVDRITFRFELTAGNTPRLLRFLRGKHNVTEYPENGAGMKFRHFFQLKYGRYVMTVQFSLNGVNSLQGKVVVNPNKCFDDTDCIDDIIVIRTLCDTFEMYLVDIALDIPEEKRFVHLMNGRRKVSYINGRKQDNKLTKAQKAKAKDVCDDDGNYITEYYGKKGHKTINGFCKLYFKTFEYGLDENITRFEMTLDTRNKNGNSAPKAVEKFFKYMPKLFITRTTDFSQHENDKDYIKYKDALERVNGTHNPHRVLKEELEMKDSEAKKANKAERALYSSYLQNKFLSLLNLEFIKPQRETLEELFNEYFSLVDKILGYTAEDVTDLVPEGFFEEEADIENEPELPVVEFMKGAHAKERSTENEW